MNAVKGRGVPSSMSTTNVELCKVQGIQVRCTLMNEPYLGCYVYALLNTVATFFSAKCSGCWQPGKLPKCEKTWKYILVFY